MFNFFKRMFKVKENARRNPWKTSKRKKVPLKGYWKEVDGKYVYVSPHLHTYPKADKDKNTKDKKVSGYELKEGNIVKDKDMAKNELACMIK